jgi:hypothetical protein
VGRSVGTSLVKAVKKRRGAELGFDCQTLTASRKDSPRPNEVSRACQVVWHAVLLFQ